MKIGQESTVTSDVDIFLSLKSPFEFRVITSSCKNASNALTTSLVRYIRTLKPFSDKINKRRSSVADTTDCMLKAFHLNGVEESCTESGCCSAESEASDIAAI